MTQQPALQELSPETRRLRQSVVKNQLLFTVGYSLTTGGFLYYFVSDLGAERGVLTIVLALPELVGLFAIFTPALLGLFRNRKRLFVLTSVLARLSSLVVPCIVFLPDTPERFHALVGGLTLLGIFQGIAYTSYLSWLSDLAPESSWGRFFARRDVAKAMILIFVPVFGAWLKGLLNQEQTDNDWKLWGYVAAFVTGNLFQLLSLWPLLPWPAVSHSCKSPVHIWDERSTEKRIFSWRNYGAIVAFSWWLSFFQGMTQTAFFLQSYRQLEVSLVIYSLLTGLMHALQMGTAATAGWMGDRYGYRELLFVSSLLVSLSLPFWIASLGGNWLWLWGAYAFWGLFGAVNLALQNQLLKIVPRHHNTFHLALSWQGAGLIAGLTGLAGGFWLENRLAEEQDLVLFGQTWSPFLLLFLISFFGRLTAPFWLLLIRKDQIPTS